MNFTKKAVACAVTAAVGGIGGAQAANISTMTIEDVTGDGLAGGFAFAAPGSTAYTNFFDSTSTVSFTPTFGSPIPITPSSTVGITAGPGEGTAVFTAGFLFSGAPFLPVSLNATGTGLNTTTPDGIAGTVADAGAPTSAVFSQFSWGGQFGTNLFPLSPTGGVFNTNTATQGGAGCAIGSANVCYELAWDSFISPQGGFSGDTIWHLEGVATLDAPVNLVPIPAAAWLFGSGLIGLVGVARRRRGKS